MRRSHLTFAVIALMALSGCGSSSETSTTDAGTAEAAPAAKAYPIGESVTAGRLEFTLQSVEERSRASDNPFADPAGPGEVFVVAKYSIKNLGSSPVETSDLPEIALLDSKDTAYSKDSLNSALVADGNLDSLNDVNPGITYRSGVAWKVAKGAFDPSKWKIVVSTDPAFEYRLK